MGLLFGRGKKSTLPYGMFDLSREVVDAKKADLMERVYHRGQERAWSGKEILPMLLERHGTPSLAPRERDALARLFAIILWGELAAWKISAQLADALEPLEAKMAATSQAFDEARHFYTIYDYLVVLGSVPEKIDVTSERVLDLTLRAESLAHKICGMQLMIETLALTIFQCIRRMNLEPVLSDLLRYFEIDEARHIALGVNYLPILIKQMNRREVLELTVFQARLLFWTVASMRHLREDFQILGLDPKEVVELGKAKQTEVFREMWADLGVDVMAERSWISRTFDASNELFFPDDLKSSRWERLQKAYERFVSDENIVDEIERSEMLSQLRKDEVLEGMGDAGKAWQEKRKRKRTQRGQPPIEEPKATTD